MLPGETWLEALHFSDYKTLVYSKLTTHRLLHLAMHHADQLASRHNFEFIVYDDYLTCDNLTVPRRRYGNFRYGRSSRAMAVVFRRFATVIGPHNITRLGFVGDAWNEFNIREIFEAAPPMKYPEAVYIYKPAGSMKVRDFTAFMSNFVGTKSLRLTITNDAYCQLNWAFLYLATARDLESITFCSSTHWSEPVSRAVEELLLVCATCHRHRHATCHRLVS